VKLSTVFLNVSRPDTAYGELATWIWLSIVPFHRCDVCDVTLPLTPLLYVTRRHNNVNPPRSVTSFMDDPCDVRRPQLVVPPHLRAPLGDSMYQLQPDK